MDGQGKFLGGTGSLAVGAVASMLTQLLLIGPVVQLAGIDVLGEWSLMMAVVGVLSVVDSGLQAALSRFSADYVRLDAVRVVRHLFRIGVTISIVFVAIVATALALGEGVIFQALGSGSSGVMLWIWIPLILLGQMLAGQARATCIGLGRSVSVGVFDVVGNAILLSTSLLALIYHPGFEALVWGALARSVFLIVANVLVMSRATRSGEPDRLRDNEAFEILRFALPVALTAGLGAAYFNVPKLVLGSMAGVDAVGAFEAVNRFAFAGLFVVQPVLANALPSLTRARADEEHSLRLSKALRGGVVVLTSIASDLAIVASVGMISAFLTLEVSRFVSTWVVLQCLAYGLIALTGVATTYLRSVQLQWIEFGSLGLALVALGGLLMAGLGGSPIGVATAMALASCLYWFVLRISMRRAACGRHAPQLPDVVVLLASTITAGAIAGVVLEGAQAIGPIQWVGMLLAGFVSCAVTGMIVLAIDPYRSAVRDVLLVVSGSIRTRSARGPL